MRRPSSHYVSRIRLKFRLAQVVVNAIALLAIGGGLTAYFKGWYIFYSDCNLTHPYYFNKNMFNGEKNVVK